MLNQPPYASSVLAFVTTIHVGLASLRNHRRRPGSRFSLLSLISFSLSSTPWLYPSALGLLFGLALHGVWFAVCEWTRRSHGNGANARRPAAAPRAPRPLPKQGSTPVASARPPVPVPVRPTGFVQTPILAVIDETADIKTIRVARPPGFGFVPGQFVPVRVHLDGSDHVRCYSISSAPHAIGYLEIAVRRQGLVSSALHATARPGAMLALKSANGAFRYPSDDDRPIVLVAGGVGITPLASMFRHAVHTEPTRLVTLLYSAHTEAAIAFRDEFTDVVRRHPQVRMFIAATRQKNPPPSVYPGRIDDALLRAAVPVPAQCLWFLCGPPSMVDAIKARLLGMGTPASQVRHELFDAAVAVSGGADVPRVAASAPGKTYAVRCATTGRTLTVRDGQTLLEAAEAQGVEVPSLCRTGVCGTCRVRVTEGEVECDSTALDPEERAEGYVLACVAVPRSACTVQA